MSEIRLDCRKKPLPCCSATLVFESESLKVSYGCWLSVRFLDLDLDIEFDRDWVDCSGKIWEEIAFQAFEKYLKEINSKDLLKIIEKIVQNSYNNGFINGKNEIRNSLRSLIFDNE